MTTSFKIARLFGIPVFLHWSFGLVGIFIVYLGFKNNLDAGELLWVTLAAIALFTSILFHEFGHALTARRFGVETKDIMLLPIGGLARLNKLPEKPFQEFLVAIAGPLVNFTIALLLLPFLIFIVAPGLETRGIPTGNTLTGDYFYFLPFVFAMNVGLAVFNLLPAFPMDGGRILRALLATWLGKLKATRIAMVVGQILAVGMCIYGFTSYNYPYAAIGIFIFIAGLREFRWVKIEHSLSGHFVRDVVRQNFSYLHLTDTLQTAFDRMKENTNHHFLIVDEEEQIIGTLSGEAVLELVEHGVPTVEISRYYHPGIAYLNMEASLKDVHERMGNIGSDILPVVENGNLVGIVDSRSVQNFMYTQLQ